ncbi:MAG: oxidoreductase domain-containing protein [Candidatus Magnetoglobus multicellularis str. Araruama]|uniref:Oxidoreductase domain-containing protein n=1 Tax=Candidatus Magnetoglobus multicellularis str. Araruama TaxID=890399 RepID=A0A1V1NZ27_9BACT|nr:MAG: oxidoreductase domain-containing protein [Candidatus Magnetoglobus multicellularis str. Araruama]
MAITVVLRKRMIQKLFIMRKYKMKQLLHSFKTGNLQLMDIPMPNYSDTQIRIQTRYSLISTGTEKMLINFGKAGYWKKARQQPEKVRQVLDKIQTDGLFSTIDAVRNKLNQPIPMGYCNVGIVNETGRNVSDFQNGDRVLSNGPHAEMVCVGHRLCAHIPDSVDDATAAFAVPGAIALQGIRLLNPTLGESIAVIGLGLIGLLTVQLLRANGCCVMGLDMDLQRCQLAESFGAEIFHITDQSDPVSAVHHFSSNKGVDGVLITAATNSNDPINHSSQMCRKKGRIVLVGVSGLNINRNLFYEKELSFQVSCAYGPGRYDPLYEDCGQDYPLPYVRWTAQRNMETVLELMAAGKINVQAMITHRFPFEKAQQAYDLIQEQSNRSIGIILEYSNDSIQDKEIPRKIEIHPSREASKATIGMIGAGNFSAQVLLPALQKTPARLRTIASKTGVSGTYLAKKFGFEKSATDLDEIFSDPEITTIVITTRHDSHANLVLRALDCGKHVFVEKPLCLTQVELNEIQDKIRYAPNSPILMVGFNRRFSPFIQKIMHFRQSVSTPLSMIMTVNAGEIPKDHWAQDLQIGGGRIVGEACHFIDLLRFIAQHPITEITPTYMAGETNDTVSIQMRFQDGSMGTIHYFANGHRRYPKERLEIFADGTIIQLDNFKRMKSYGTKICSSLPHRQDKGHRGKWMRLFLQLLMVLVRRFLWMRFLRLWKWF